MNSLNKHFLVIAAICWMIPHLAESSEKKEEIWTPAEEPNCNWAFHQKHFVACNLYDARARALSLYLSTRIDTNQKD